MRFNEWCDANGVVRPSIEWPVAYGPEGQLIGARATRGIGLMSAYLYVPVKVTVNVESFQRSEIARIYAEHEDEFDDVGQHEHFPLVFFVAY